MISGFTILNGVARLDYPFEASIQSLLPLVDELVVNVGEIDDGTFETIARMADPRIRILRTAWDWGLGAVVLSLETNRTLRACSGEWAVYLQADEVLHERDLAAVRSALTRASHDVDALVFDVLHFVGGYNAVSHDWLTYYPRAVRAIRTGRGIESSGDAAGFSRPLGLVKKHSGGRVFHYGRCNPPDVQFQRIRNLAALCDPERVESLRPEHFALLDANVRRFDGTHPATMRDRAARGLVRSEVRAARVSPLWWAWARLLRAPRQRLYAARPFLPLALTNAYWRFQRLAQKKRRPA